MELDAMPMHLDVTKSIYDNQLYLDHLLDAYYYLFVNRTVHSTINWVLITMMVLLPLKSALAADQSCEVPEQASQQPAMHHAHAGHMLPESDHSDTVVSDHCCCGESAMSCSSDCGIGMSASVIMQYAVTVPVLNKSSFRTQVVNNLVFREVIPPTRPPAYL